MKAEKTPIMTNTAVLDVDAHNGNEDRIRTRAYELFEMRNREDGHAIDDWLQAEAELTRSEGSAA